MSKKLYVTHSARFIFSDLAHIICIKNDFTPSNFHLVYMINAMKHMQHSVDIVLNSDHPTSKVAATITGQDNSGDTYIISRTNHWPDVIKDKIGTKTRIGSSSGTIHAETDCILSAPGTDGAEIYITDPPCPNCVKNMAEAGIKALYIDHKGFDKDFAQRRGDDFETMSMRICEKAGIAVYVVFRKEHRVETVFEPTDKYIPATENPVITNDCNPWNDTDDFKRAIMSLTDLFSKNPIACALAIDTAGKHRLIGASTHPVAGYTSDTIGEQEGKYSYILQPLNRIMMNASRYGLRLDKNHVFSSRVPTSRELVNFIGAGFNHLHIGNTSESRDEEALEALEQLRNAKILDVE